MSPGTGRRSDCTITRPPHARPHPDEGACSLIGRNFRLVALSRRVPAAGVSR
ncbi:hypothetical protein SLNWT_3451 [Streptomyces albus]|uniref:Uncharacterized protein n=1 Tax=Streptomyces albus (strain ATCC 21838 / DSM 41398 / FERM P-419 / JCM 4703 / NBRC 107858) TaxID=1081613 RepID=A0A0B5F0K2_STRA4|nr:hypothetical protein SLNWT_3451 [Streptomyces albus]AOU78132.1 hypothetical protein SLNHY_3441 [Streptomyces albus]AYN33888.1 hypothetical protein DUI70_3386 [Streptomyces albus]